MSTVILVLILAMFIIFGFKRTLYFMGGVLILLVALSFFGIAISILPFAIFIIFIYMLVNKNKSGNRGYTFKFKVGDSEDFFKRFYEYQQQYQNGYQKQTVYTENPEKYYNILGINDSASEDEIKKSYKLLAKKYHPDVHNNKEDNEKLDMEKKFKELNEAYDKIKKIKGIN